MAEFGLGEIRKSEGTWTYEYDPFGGAAAMRDAGNGLVLTRTRAYAPDQGRFVSRDPSVTPIGNLYLYCANDPVNGIDPSGYVWKELREGFLSSVEGARSKIGFTLDVVGKHFEPTVWRRICELHHSLSDKHRGARRVLLGSRHCV